jgi:DNA-binding PucR family transcriptional regulator
VAVGGPASGAEGFRRAHTEAQSAHRVALRRPAPVTLYDDVALEALAAEDDSRARAFVARELGPLAADDPRALTLRATLRAYFGVAQNASSAAALLGVHERTVANRLRAVEEHLGRPVSARHAELDTALRLHELLVD